MIHVLPEFGLWVQPLYNLANTPFEPAAFKSACEAISPIDEESSFDDHWRFAVAPGFPLIVGVDVAPTGKERLPGWPGYRPVRVLCALLSVCWWETYLRNQHPTATSHQQERREFDHQYSNVLNKAVMTLGKPLLEFTVDDKQEHQWALWRGRTGLFVVQQSAYDPQFGLDINFWVSPWSGLDPRPTSPFIDWLVQLSEPGQSAAK